MRKEERCPGSFAEVTDEMEEDPFSGWNDDVVPFRCPVCLRWLQPQQRYPKKHRYGTARLPLHRHAAPKRDTAGERIPSPREIAETERLNAEKEQSQ